MSNDFSEKYILFFVLIVFLGVAAYNLAQGCPQLVQDNQVLHWDTVLKAYDTYVDYPSLDNAKALLAVLPADRLDKESGNAGDALEHIFSLNSYPVLLEEALSGERVVIEIFFRLLNISDGLYAENVLSELGWVARNHPLLFLEILLAYKDTRNMRNMLGYPVDFVGAGHNMHPKAAIYILGKRIEALETVKDPKYEKIKEACIRQLRFAIKQVSEIGQP